MLDAKAGPRVPSSFRRPPGQARCGNSSVGRASASQAEGRRFESGFPLRGRPAQCAWAGLSRSTGALAGRARRAVRAQAGRQRDGRLAQMVRASRLHREGRGFESLTAHPNAAAGGRPGRGLPGRRTRARRRPALCGDPWRPPPLRAAGAPGPLAPGTAGPKPAQSPGRPRRWAGSGSAAPDGPEPALGGLARRAREGTGLGAPADGRLTPGGGILSRLFVPRFSPPRPRWQRSPTAPPASSRSTSRRR